MSVYAGKYLRIDLTNRTWREAPISEEEARQWLLGSGYAAHLYAQEMDPNLDPLDPNATLYIFNGLLVGTFAPTASRTSFCGRSPLTGIWNESNVGHHWGAELRFAGYDGIVITGASETPLYLFINGLDGSIEFRDASHLWGKDWFEAGDAMLAETDPKGQVAGIGIAGERLVKMAGVTVGPSHYVRIAGRGGMGAIFGSKKLKGIAVRGKKRPDYPDRKRFLATVKAQNKYIKENSVGMSLLGTAGGFQATEEYGDLALKNWRLGTWELAKDLTGAVLYEKYLIRHTHCFSCPIGCGKEIEVPEGPYKTPRGEGIEYETMAGFFGNVLNGNMEAGILANSLCNRYGLDTISTSSTIAFAMEAYEKGLITNEDTGGMALNFGDPDVALELIRQIAFREGVGDLLAEGSRAAAQKLGRGAEDFAVHAKGMEVAYHDPRGFVSMAVNYATANRGGCHLEALSYWNGYGLTLPDLGYGEVKPRLESSPEAAQMAYDFQNYFAVYNPLGLCKFIAKGKIGPERLAEIVNAAMDWEWTPEDVIRMGEKLFQLKRVINNRLGVTARDDTLPKRLLKDARPDGSAGGNLPNLELMLPIYYELRGWDEEGRPTPERLHALGLA
ncbi:MAG TPA: aldehyde ferredoxin oxidoreductase family protein [Caldilineae bacterium]|nr:aldehyde ferredoxin oxidoreductase family protein [Caldilineae bacterium]HIQ12042.1 aldehyde ferredoxin oxidoreductase [Caldilineales bacterium]